MQELAEELTRRKHKVSVVTSYPQYNLADEMKGKSFDEYSIENEIEVLRIRTMPHHKVNLIIRGIAQLSMPYIFLSKIRRHLKQGFDIVIVYSPPLPLANIGRILKKKNNAKFILNIQDIFPQNAIDLGALKNSFIIRYFEHMEKKAYEHADAVTVHSHGNKQFLLSKKRISEEKLHVLHNWIDLSPYSNIKADNYFRGKYALENKFIILFAGVIGPSQGLDMVIKAATKLGNISDLCFLIVGDGTEKDRLMRIVKDYQLKNVIFKPFVSKDDYPKLVKEANVGLVCLTSLNKTPVVPGKILGYMGAAIPVLAFLNKESDGHQIIREAQCGYSEISNDYKKIVDSVIKIYNERDQLREYGNNGYKYVATHFEKSKCIDKLEKLF